MVQQEKIQDILKRRLAHYGLDKAAAAARVCAVAKEVGEAHVSSAGGKFEVISFKNGVLKIAVKSIAAAHMIRLRQKTLILKINEELKSDLVKKIKFTL